MSRETDIQCLGYSVKADVYDGGSGNVTLMLIGWTSEKKKYVKFAEAIVKQLGDTVVVLDYSGHGVSPYNIDDVMPAENFVEVVRTFDWMKRELQPNEISVIGTSYGSFMATQLTKYRVFDKIILRVPAIYEPANFYTKWADYDHDEGLRYRSETKGLVNHPLLNRAKDFKGKSLVVLHENDERCPLNSTQAFIDAFNAESWTWPDLVHGFASSGISPEDEQAYYKKIIDWMKR